MGNENRQTAETRLYENSPVLETKRLSDRRTIVFFAAANEKMPSSWYLLNPQESLIVSSINEETSRWFEDRTSVPLPSGNTQLFVYDAQEGTVRTIMPETQPLDTKTIGIFERLHGTTGPARENYYPDTPKIQEQKKAAKKQVDKLVQDAIAHKTNVVRIANQAQESLYFVSTSEAMAQASVIKGDQQSVDLKETTQLLKPNGMLLVKVEPDGKISYGSPFWGKATAESTNNLRSFKTGLTTLHEVMSQVSLANKQQIDRVRAHLVKHLLANASEAYPSESNFPKTTRFDMKAKIGEVLNDVPKHLEDYLRSVWLPDALRKEEIRQKERTIQIGGLPEDVIESYLVVPISEREKFLAEYSITKQLAIEKDELLHKAGILALGESTEKACSEIYTRLLGIFSVDDGSKIIDYINSLEDVNVIRQAKKLLNDLQAKGNNQTIVKGLAEFFCSLQFSQLLEEKGRRYLATHKITDQLRAAHIESSMSSRTYDRVDRLIQPSQSFATIISRQVNEFETHNPNNAPAIYNTSQFEEVAANLKAAGFGKAASISWMNAESYAEVSGRKKFETFATAVGIATQIAKRLYVDPEAFAKELGFRENSQPYKNLLQLADSIRAALDWNLPEFLPRPNHGGNTTQLPLMLIRPDFAREQLPDGSMRWIATELENSPGGLGMELVVMAANPEIRSNLVDNFYQFMQDAAVPESVKRNQLTVIMTEEWQPYRTELEVFLDDLQKKKGVVTKIYSIEELTQNPSLQIEPGFVFHFAYTWNFMKHPEQYYVNLMKYPNKVAYALGVSVDSVVQEKYRGRQNAQQLAKDLKETTDFGDKKFKSELRLPTKYWEDGLRRYIYVNNLSSLRSQNPLYQGLTLEEIGRAKAEQMTRKAHEIYRRQENDLLIFNDPYMGNFVNGKNDLAILHLPGFSDVLQIAMENSYGFSRRETRTFVESLQQMTAQTIPLALHTGNKELTDYVQRHVDDALHHKDEWIIKVSADPQFGSVDWGSRGLVKGGETKEESWRELLMKACESDIPWVLQRVIQNTPFDQRRQERNARPINADGKELVALYNRDPHDTHFAVGELQTTKTRGRFNPFLFTYRNRQGQLVSLVSDGILTLTPYDEDKKAQAVHGTSESAMTGVRIVN